MSDSDSDCDYLNLDNLISEEDLVCEIQQHIIDKKCYLVDRELTYDQIMEHMVDLQNLGELKIMIEELEENNINIDDFETDKDYLYNVEKNTIKEEIDEIIFYDADDLYQNYVICNINTLKSETRHLYNDVFLQMFKPNMTKILIEYENIISTLINCDISYYIMKHYKNIFINEIKKNSYEIINSFQSKNIKKQLKNISFADIDYNLKTTSSKDLIEYTKEEKQLYKIEVHSKYQKWFN